MKRFIPLFFFLLGSIYGFCLSYNIDARLNPEKKEITGKEVIVFSHNSDTPVSFIPFHLYMNAFSNNKTVFMAESGGRHRNFRFKCSKPECFGYCKVKSVKLNGKDKSKHFKYLREVKNPETLGLFWKDEITGLRVKPDNTIGVLFLDKPLKKGEKLEIEIVFETKFPRVFARTGYWKTFFMAGQWFPKVAVYEKSGKWNCHLFHLNSEFFADFSDYTVSITAPSDFVIGATGVKVETKKQGGFITSVFKAQNVIDFAWSAWDRFKIAQDRWHNVPLTLLYPPGLEHTVKRQFKALKTAMTYYAELTGHPYPYPHFTLICPPPQAQGAGGMEYPMLVSGGFTFYKIPEGLRFPEMLIIHEFGHNYFYAIFATNEFEDAWMDEGINSFATAYALEKGYKMQVDLPFLKVPPFTLERIGFVQYKGREAPSEASWEFVSNSVYTTLSYSKPTIYLKTLENLIGEDRFKKIFLLYYQKFAFTHPSPEDFFSCVKQVAGQGYYNFIKKAITTGSTLDFAIPLAQSHRVKPLAGFDFNFRFVKDRGDKENEEKEEYINRVIVENRGDFENLPVKVLVVLKNGEKRLFEWDGKGKWKGFEFKSKSPIAYAFADPDRVYVCDNNLTNNVKSYTSKTGDILSAYSLGLATLVEFLINMLTLGI